LILAPLTFCLLLVDSQDGNPKAAQTTPPTQEATSVNYGLGGIVPTNQPYRPLTGGERARFWAKTNFTTPPVYLRAFLFTIPEHRSNRPSEWGPGAAGYARRAGSRAARFTMLSSVEMAGAAVLGHEPRYVASRDGQKGFARFAHTFQYVFMTYNREGKPVLHVSRFAGQVVSEGIASAWIPRSDLRRSLTRGVGEQVAISWMSNIGREYGPQLIRKFSRKKKKTP